MSLSLSSRLLHYTPKLKPQSLSYVSNLTRTKIRTRTMATAPEKFEWIVIMPDQPGKLAKRMEVRP
jgi:hypothetical protein